MKLKIFLPILAAVILVGAGCAKENDSPSAATPTGAAPAATAPSVEAHGGDHLAKLAGTRIELENKNNLQPGEVTLRFKLYGLDGHEFGDKDLKIAHEKKMHFLMVRDDMTGFQHLHPEFTDKKWVVKTTIPEAGAYQLYVDVEPVEEEPIVLRVPVTIGGATAQAKTPAPSANLSAENAGYITKLTTNGSIKTNETVSLSFTVIKNGTPVTSIEPYLGAYGHVVLLRHTDPDDFFHVHPITETKPADGQVKFEAEFPVKGRYTLYAQFNIDGTVRTFPITVDVNEDGQGTVTNEGAGGAHH